MKSTARTNIRALLQETQPSLDLSVGGPVDSIIVEGNVDISAQSSVDLASAILQNQLKAIADGTVTPTDEEVDDLMAGYYLTRNVGTAAYGTIEFIVQRDEAIVLPAGYKLTVNGVVYKTLITYNVYPTAVVVDLSNPSNRQLYVAYDTETGFLYRFRIDVTADEVGPDGVLVAGTRLTPVQSFSGLGYVQAITNFSGGTTAETNAAFASRALDGLTANIVAGQVNVDKLVTGAYPLAMASLVGFDSALMVRNRNNVFALPTSGKLDIYTKSGILATDSLRVTATVTDFANRLISVTLPAPYSYGVYKTDVVAALTGGPVTVVSGGVEVQSSATAASTRTDFNPSGMDAVDRAFSANATITLVVKDDRQDGSGYIVPMTSNGQVISDIYSIVYTYMPGVAAIADALYAADTRPPGMDILVKAAVPCVTTLNITAYRQPGVNGNTLETIENSISASINQLAMRQPGLSPYTISSILTAASPDLVLVAVSMNGTIYGQDGVDVAISAVNSTLAIPTSVAGRYSYENVFFTTTPALITVTIV